MCITAMRNWNVNKLRDEVVDTDNPTMDELLHLYFEEYYFLARCSKK